MHDRHHEDLGDDLRDQLANLSHEVARLKKQMVRQSRGGWRETRHRGEEIAEMMRDYYDSLPDFRHGAQRLQRSAEANPAAAAGVAAVAVIVVGLAASLLMRR